MPSKEITMKRHIIFFVPFTYWEVHLQVDVLLAAALQARGHRVTLVRCNRLYRRCPSTLEPIPPCTHCICRGNDILERFDLSQIALNVYQDPTETALLESWAEALDDVQIPEAVYDGLPLGAWARSTVNTHWRQEFNGPLSSDVLSVYRCYLVEAAQTYLMMRRLIRHQRPDAMVVFNGRFYPLRAAVEAATAERVDFITHERGVGKNSFTFYDRDTCEYNGAWRDHYLPHQNTPLSVAEINAVEALFTERGLGTLNFFPLARSDSVDVPVEFRLGLPPDRPVVGVFTTSPDELSLRYQNDGVRQELLIENLFAFFADRPEIVIVRHHPLIGGANWTVPSRRVMEVFAEQKRRAPPNFRIILPDEDVSSYQILPLIERAIVPYSTMAAEVAFHGIRCLVLDISLFATPFPDQVSSFEQHELFPALTRLLDEEHAYGPAFYQGLYRFLYAAFVRSSFVFRSIGIKNVFDADLADLRTETLMPGVDLELDRVCDRLIQGASLFGHAGIVPPGAGERENVEIAGRVSARLAQRPALRDPTLFFLRLHKYCEDLCASRAAEQNSKAVVNQTIDRLEQELAACRTNLAETVALSAQHETRTDGVWIALLRWITGRRLH